MIPHDTAIKISHRFILVCTLIFLIGHISAQDEKGVFFRKKRNKVDISTIELRLRLTDFFIRFTEVVEEAADRIYYDTSDPGIKKATLMMKIYGISAMNKAINLPDPIASFYNAWPFSKQLIRFFDEGKGKEELGPYHEEIVQLCVKLEAKMDSIIVDIGGIESYHNTEPLVDEWAEAHPLEDFYFTRESTLEFFSKWIGEARFGIGKNVSNMTEELTNLSNKLNLYVDLLPRQARWQADYALMDYLNDSSVNGRIDQLINDLDRITMVIENTPDVIEYNREATLRDIDVQREKSLQLLISERKAVIEDIRKERIEVVSTIIEERKAVLEELKNERAIVLEEIRDILNNVVMQTGNQVEKISNLVFWRLTVISIILGSCIIISVILYKKL